MNLKKSILVTFLIALFACIFVYSDINTKVTQESKGNTIFLKAYVDYQSYGSIKELSDKSTVIIKGEVTKVHAPETIKMHIPDGKILEDVVTVSDVRVIETIKGDIKPGESIQVKQRGGFYKGRMYTPDGPELFTENMQGVFFLETYDGFPAWCMNPTQGFIKIVDGVLEVPNDSDMFNVIPEFSDGADAEHIIELIKDVN